jgi:hypothetical protein
VQRPIPIWFGGSSDAVVKRAARLGGGNDAPAVDASQGHCHIKRFYCPLLTSTMKPDSINSNS